MSTLILCDYSWILHRYAFGFKDKFTEDNNGNKLFIGTILGFTLLIERIRGKYPDAKIIFCMEGKNTKINLNDNYKAQREKKEHVYDNDMPIVSLLSLVPKVYFAKSEDHEGDDLIARLAFKFKNDFDEIIIHSGDKDFYQLSDTFKIANEFDKGFKFVNNNTVFEKFGVPAKDILGFRVLDGDASDNLKSPVPRTQKEFRRLLAEMWHPLTEESLLATLKLLEGTQWDTTVKKHLNAVDGIMTNLEIMNLQKYDNESNAFNYRLFKDNSPRRELVNYYGLRQFESFLYDLKRG